MIRMYTVQSQVPLVDLATQYAGIAREIDGAVSKVIPETGERHRRNRLECGSPAPLVVGCGE